MLPGVTSGHFTALSLCSSEMILLDMIIIIITITALSAADDDKLSALTTR